MGGVKHLKISDLCVDLFAGGDVPKGNWSKEKNEKYIIPIYSNGTNENALYGYTDMVRVNQDALTISARGTIGFVEIRKAPFFPVVRLIVAIPDTNKMVLKFFKYILSHTDIESLGKTGGTIPQLTVPVLRELQIPVPSLAKQQEIVSEIEGYEAEIKKLETIMQQSAERKKEILEKYL